MQLAEKLDWKGLMKFESSQQIFEKYSNSKIHDNPFSGSPDVPCSWTDGRTDRRQTWRS